MRTREEILHRTTPHYIQEDGTMTNNDDLILEVLLDIRELLTPIRPTMYGKVQDPTNS